MKIVKFETETEALDEATRLGTVLNLPEGFTYGEPFKYAGGWALKVKENGTWPVTNLIQGTIEELVFEEDSPE